ncbi:PucR family transcriptional regulator [Pseudobacillus badius]|uniref:PucR family transcriptional regulator n=1 Tax=Bacillus badius TaxID=1455 RepID=UPI003CECA31F
MSITVKEALSLPDFQQIKLIAGEAGAHRIIKWVTIVEIIEDVTRVQAGEFLITTGYGMEVEENRRRLIDQLANQRLSAIAVHTGFYLKTIHPDLIDAANRYELPLIEIPKHLNFSDVTQTLLGHIVNKNFQNIQITQKVHHELTSLVLSNKGLSSVLATLSKHMEADVYLYNSLQGCFEGENIPVELSDWKLAPPAKPTLINDSQFVYPIATDQNYYGYLMVVKHIPLTELDDLLLEQASIVCALEFLKQKTVQEVFLRLQGDFFDELLEQSELDPKYIQEQCYKLNYDSSGEFLIMQLHSTTSESAVLTSFIRYWNMTCKVNILIREKYHSVILLIKLPVNKEERSTMIQTIVQGWKNYAKEPLYIGISDAFQGLNDVSVRAREAKYALQTALLTKKQVLSYREIGAYEALFEMKEMKVDLSKFYSKWLQPLLAYDEKHESYLLNTLECYLQNKTNIKNAAAELFIHRHTLKYRLEKIEEKTERDLQDAHNLTQFHLAIMAYRLDHSDSSLFY